MTLGSARRALLRYPVDRVALDRSRREEKRGHVSASLARLSAGRASRFVAVLFCAAAALLSASAAWGANPPQPNSMTQPLVDGCQRNATGLLTFTSPEWVYIYKDPTVR